MVIAFIGIAFLSLISDSWAVLLNKASWVSLKGTTLAARKELAGRVLKDNIMDFEIRGADGNLVFKGKLQDRVVKSKTTGKLHFYLYIRNTQSGLPGAILTVHRKDFANFRTDVDYRLDGLGDIGPVGAIRSGNAGEEITFVFSPGKAEHPEWGDKPVHSGSESKFFFVITDATQYNHNGMTTIYAGNGSVKLVTFAPIH